MSSSIDEFSASGTEFFPTAYSEIASKDEETATTFSDLSSSTPSEEQMNVAGLQISTEMISYLRDQRELENVGNVGNVGNVRNVGTSDSINHKSELDQVLAGYYREKQAKAEKSKGGERRRSSIHERLYKEGQHAAVMKAFAQKQKLDEQKLLETPKLTLATRSYTPLRSRDTSEKTHERLYKMGVSKKKQLIEDEKQKIEDEKRKPEIPKLALATRSYTPLRSRDGGEKTYERLYKMGITKKKQAIEEEAKADAYHAKHLPKQKAIDGKNSSSRLYEDSRNYREEGKKRRQMIAKKLARDPTPTRSISAARGQKIYERGLVFNANRDKKLEEIKNTPRKSTFPSMRTQTPSRRDCFFDSRDDSSIRSGRSRGSSSSIPVRMQKPIRSRTPSRDRSVTPTSRTSNRSQTPSRARSQTPSRSRSQTPSRSRSQTPNRRVSSSNMNRPQTTPLTGSSPKLPRSFKTQKSAD